MNEVVKLLNKYIRFNLSGVFTVLPYLNYINKNIDKVIQVYAYNIEEIDIDTGELDNSYIYVVLENSLLENEVIKVKGYRSHELTDDYMILKLNRRSYLSDKDWDIITNNRIEEYVNTDLYRSIRNTESEYSLFRLIIERSKLLKDAMSEITGEDISKEKICWNTFDTEKEILDLSKFQKMEVLGYYKHKLIKLMENAISFEKHVYQGILDISFPITAPAVTAMQSKPKADHSEMYDRLKNELKRLTGKPQKKLTFDGKEYPFMPNKLSFNKKLTSFIKTYKMDDLQKIEKLLTEHLTKENKLLSNYIMKRDESDLATDYENYEEVVKRKKPQL